MQVKVITDSAEYPVTLEEVKNYIKVDFEEDNQLIQMLIQGVTGAAEKFTQLSFITKTLEAYSDNWEDVYELPYGPHQSITTVTRIAEDSTETVLTTDQYTTKGLNYISLTTGRQFRLSEGWINNRVRVRYVAGFGDASMVPSEIKIAILKEVAELYENRENTISGSIVADLTTTTKTLLFPFKRNVLI